MFKKFLVDKINALVFVLQDTTYQSFAFNLPFQYELKHKAHLSKRACEIFHF